MKDTWNDIAKYVKKKARTNLDDKIAKIRKERKDTNQTGNEVVVSDSSDSSEEELSEDELVEDQVKVKQKDLKRKSKKKQNGQQPDSGIDIQIENPESDNAEEEEYFDTAPVYSESDSFYSMNLSRP